MRSFLIAVLVVLLGAFSGPMFAMAVEQSGVGNTPPTSQSGVGNTGSSVSLINPFQGKGAGTLQSFLDSILDFVIEIGSIVIVLMIVFVGYKFVMARGVPGEIEKAKTMLLWTVIGALVLLGAKAISAGILDTVNAL